MCLMIANDGDLRLGIGVEVEIEVDELICLAFASEILCLSMIAAEPFRLEINEVGTFISDKAERKGEKPTGT